MAVVRTEVFIKAPPDVVFDAARDVDLHAETCRSTRERIVGGRLHGMLELGDTVTFEAVHFGVRQRLTSKIIAFDRPHRFLDEMLAGAFQRLTHEHLFEAQEGGTLMIDILDFQSPLGVLGHLADKLVVARHMHRFVLARGLELKKLIEQGSVHNTISRKP